MPVSGERRRWRNISFAKDTGGISGRDNISKEMGMPKYIKKTTKEQDDYLRKWLIDMGFVEIDKTGAVIKFNGNVKYK